VHGCSNAIEATCRSSPWCLSRELAAFRHDVRQLLSFQLFKHLSPLVSFAALSASYFSHIGFFNPYLSLWLKDQGMTLWVIGLMGSMQSLSRIIAPYLWGWLSDHTGQRVLLLRASAGLALVSSWGMNAHELPWLVGMLFFMFLNTSGMMPMTEAALSHWVSVGGVLDTHRYGRVRLFGSLGFLLTVCFAGAWFERHGMVDFPMCTVLTLLALNISVWSLPNSKENVSVKGHQGSVVKELFKAHNAWFFATMFFHVLSHMCIYFYLSLYLDHLGYSKTMIGLLWGVGVVVEIGAFYTQSRWLHRFSMGQWLMVCCGCMVIRMGLTSFCSEWLLILFLAQALHGITFAVQHTVSISWLSIYFPGRLRGRGQALYSIVGYGVTGVIGSVSGAWLSEKFGLQSLFTISLLLALLGFICAYMLNFQIKKKRQSLTG
jgi:MFS transporter, PPP family, 3-phenylpropionic acid transporter